MLLQRVQTIVLQVQARDNLPVIRQIELLQSAQTNLRETVGDDFAFNFDFIDHIIRGLQASDDATATARPTRHHPEPRVFSTANQQRFDELGLTELPEEMYCAISGQIMDDPVKITVGNLIVDRALWDQLNKHPTTRAEKQAGDIEECPELKARIRTFMENPQNPQRDEDPAPEAANRCTIL
jgi:hypothetical protein